MIILIGSLIQVATLCLVNFILIQRKVDNRQLLIVFVIAICSGFLFLRLGILSIFIPIFILMVLNYRYLKNILTSVMVPLLSLFILVISDHFSFLMDIHIFHINVETVDTKISALLIHELFFILFALGIGYIMDILHHQLRQSIPLSKKYSGLILLLIGLTIAFIYYNFIISNDIGFSKEIIQLNTYIILIYVLFIILIIGLLVSFIVKELQVKNKQEEYKQLRNYSENLERMYGEMQKFRHDYMNILVSLSEYIRERDMENLEAFFHEKVMPTSKGIEITQHKFTTLKNMKITEVKGTLVAKMLRAQQLNIDTTIEIAEPIVEINMDTIILCRCLGIILDNAIEEANEQDGGRMMVAFVKKENAIIIVVVNTIGNRAPALHKIFKKGYSTKGKNRGLGLSNLKELISQCHHVTLETKIEGNLFFQEITIHSTEEGG